MPGARGGLGRMVTMGVALALALLLLGAREATAGNYSVAQCGWGVEADASWADTTGGVKFRPAAWCGFGGEHLQSLTRGGHATVSGTRFARWRWEAPAGTGISRVWGKWWQALHDGMEQRFGAGTGDGGFSPTLRATATDTAQRDFYTEFSIPAPAIEDRLLCARGTEKWCSLQPGSWSAIRSLTIDVFDGHTPVPGEAGAELAAGGWRRGDQRVNYWDTDVGGGVRFSETLLDGARVGLTEYPCAKAMIDGQWRATRMQPCPTGAADEVTVATTRFSDGPHALTRCAVDFAGNPACLFPVTVLIDNNPPAQPRKPVVAGGAGWRRVNDFDLGWVNPDQGPASPIGGAHWRIVGPAGFDSGVRFAAGRGIAALADRRVPRPGAYALHLWLRDEAGNQAPSTAVQVPLRFDDVPPGVAFEPAPELAAGQLPEVVAAMVGDAHSGPAGGEIHYRRLNGERWIELPTQLRAGQGERPARLVAALPELAPGTYVFRAAARDGAGNRSTTTRRADGSQMALRKVPPPVVPARAASRGVAQPGPQAAPRATAKAKAKTRIFARLRRGRRAGRQVTAPFGGGAVLSGRLLTAGGAGLAGRKLRVVSRFSRGAFRRKRVETLLTGKRGRFRLPLRSGPSRRVTVLFRGARGLRGSRRAGMSLRVRGGLTLAAAPRRLRTGQSVRFRGRLRSRGAPLPRRGKLVAIQYYERDARRWRPVLVTRSDHGGRFARYRFRYVSGTARIRLRAVALAEERWPYAPGGSRPVVVRVTG